MDERVEQSAKFLAEKERMNERLNGFLYGKPRLVSIYFACNLVFMCGLEATNGKHVRTF